MQNLLGLVFNLKISEADHSDTKIIQKLGSNRICTEAQDAVFEIFLERVFGFGADAT